MSYIRPEARLILLLCKTLIIATNFVLHGCSKLRSYGCTCSLSQKEQLNLKPEWNRIKWLTRQTGPCPHQQHTWLQVQVRECSGKSCSNIAVASVFHLFVLIQCWMLFTPITASWSDKDCSDCGHKQWDWHKFTAIVIAIKPPYVWRC